MRSRLGVALTQVAWPIVLIVTALIVLAVFVLPTRTWLDQRAAAEQIKEEMISVRAQNAALEGEIALLQTNDEIERIARADFGFVYPGEEAYAILPPPEEPVVVPDAWPFGVLRDAVAAG